MGVSKRALASWLLLLLAAIVGCHTTWATRIRCPSPLRPVASLGEDRAFRTRAHIERGSRRAVLDLVIEKYDGRLVVLARNELGAVAFVITQEGDETALPQALPGRFLPLPPRILLRDIQTLYFPDAGLRHPPKRAMTLSRCGYRVRFSREPESAS